MIMTGQSCWQLRSVPDCVLTDGAVAASLQGHSLLYLIFSCEHMCRSHSGVLSVREDQTRKWPLAQCKARHRGSL